MYAPYGKLTVLHKIYQTFLRPISIMFENFTKTAKLAFMWFTSFILYSHCWRWHIFFTTNLTTWWAHSCISTDKKTLYSNTRIFSTIQFVKTLSFFNTSKTLIFEFWIWAFSNDVYFIAAFPTVWTYALLSLSFNQQIIKFNCEFVLLAMVLSYTPETKKSKYLSN